MGVLWPPATMLFTANREVRVARFPPRMGWGWGKGICHFEGPSPYPSSEDACLPHNLKRFRLRDDIWLSLRGYQPSKPTLLFHDLDCYCVFASPHSQATNTVHSPLPNQVKNPVSILLLLCTNQIYWILTFVSVCFFMLTFSHKAYLFIHNFSKTVMKRANESITASNKNDRLKPFMDSQGQK